MIRTVKNREGTTRIQIEKRAEGTDYSSSTTTFVFFFFGEAGWGIACRFAEMMSYAWIGVRKGGPMVEGRN